MFDDDLIFTTDPKRAPVVFPGDDQEGEAFRAAELVMATLFKRRYAHLNAEPVRSDARHLQEELQQALAA